MHRLFRESESQLTGKIRRESLYNPEGSIVVPLRSISSGTTAGPLGYAVASMEFGFESKTIAGMVSGSKFHNRPKLKYRSTCIPPNLIRPNQLARPNVLLEWAGVTKGLEKWRKALIKALPQTYTEVVWVSQRGVNFRAHLSYGPQRPHNIRILYSASEIQNQEDTRNHGCL